MTAARRFRAAAFGAAALAVTTACDDAASREARLTELRETALAIEREVAEIRVEIDYDRILRQDAMAADPGEARLREARADLESRQTQLRLARDQLGRPESPYMQVEVISMLRNRDMDIRVRLAETIALHGETDPQVAALRAQLADNERQIEAEIRRILQSLQNGVTAAHERVVALEEEIAGSGGDLVLSPEDLRRLRSLEREAEAANAAYEAQLAARGER